jgi:CRP/FNR family cyclic AMP-dependent transcriptional regulator
MDTIRIELLQRMPVFGAIDTAALAFLIEHSRSVAVPAGEFFFREGEQAEAMFVLEAGSAAVIKQWQGRAITLHQLQAGDCFGEMALMDLLPRSAAVQALEDCSAIEVRPAALHRLHEHDAEQFTLIQMNLGREVCRRLRTTDDLLFRAAMGDLPAGPAATFRST